MFARRLKNKIDLKCETDLGTRLCLVSPNCSEADQRELVESASAPLIHSCESSLVSEPAPENLSGDGNGEPGVSFGWLKDRLAFVSIASAGVLPFAVLQFMGSHLNLMMTGMQTNEFMELTRDSSCVAVSLLMFLFYEMNRALCGVRHTKISLAVRGALALFVLLIGLKYGLMGSIIALIAVALVLLVNYLCRLVRAAVPATFRFRKSVWNMALAASPGCLLFLYLFGTAVGKVLPVPASEGGEILSTASVSMPYSDTTTFEFFFMAALLSLFLFIPTYAAMRAARSREAAPLALLAVLYQTPFFLASLLEASLMVFQPGGLTVAASICLCNFIAGAILLFSAREAARANGALHDRQISGSK